MAESRDRPGIWECRCVDRFVRRTDHRAIVAGCAIAADIAPAAAGTPPLEPVSSGAQLAALPILPAVTLPSSNGVVPDTGALVGLLSKLPPLP